MEDSRSLTQWDCQAWDVLTPFSHHFCFVFMTLKHSLHKFYVSQGCLSPRLKPSPFEDCYTHLIFLDHSAEHSTGFIILRTFSSLYSETLLSLDFPLSATSLQRLSEFLHHLSLTLVLCRTLSSSLIPFIHNFLSLIHQICPRLQLSPTDQWSSLYPYPELYSKLPTKSFNTCTHPILYSCPPHLSFLPASCMALTLVQSTRVEHFLHASTSPPDHSGPKSHGSITKTF